MPLTDMAAAWPKIASTELVAKVVLVLLFVKVVRFFYSGLVIRLKFRKLQAQGQVRVCPSLQAPSTFAPRFRVVAWNFYLY